MEPRGCNPWAISGRSPRLALVEELAVAVRRSPSATAPSRSAEDLVGWLQEIVSDPDEPTGVSAVAPTMTLDEVNVAHEKAIEKKVKALGAPEIKLAGPR
jgi:hypothetical protein